MQYRDRLQKINITEDNAFCKSCRANLLDIGNIKFIKNSISGSNFSEELYLCRHCNQEFIIRYELFDKEGHIQRSVFSEDPNDPKFNWPDLLTAEQKLAISDHLKSCDTCNKRLIEGIESNVWFASLIHSHKGESHV